MHRTYVQLLSTMRVAIENALQLYRSIELETVDANLSSMFLNAIYMHLVLLTATHAVSSFVFLCCSWKKKKLSWAFSLTW